MKKHKAKDKIKNYSITELRHLSKFVFDYCVQHLGVNNRKRKSLDFILDINKHPEDYYGWYDTIEHTIYIKLINIKTVKDLTSTIIHEYTHSLQPCRTHYFRLLKEHGYKKHPYEIEARKNEILFKKALREYRKII